MPTQTEFSMKPGGDSQCARILERLQASANKRVPMPELARIGSGLENGFCMVHSRIADLRKRGNVIEHTHAWEDGQCLSFYRLILQEEQQPAI